MTVTEVGGDDSEGLADRSGMGANENAAWVNAPGELMVVRSLRRRLDHASNPDSSRQNPGRCYSKYDPGRQLDCDKPRLHGGKF